MTTVQDLADVAAYAVSASGAAVATVVLVAPVSLHRITFREGRKPDLVAFASILALLGLIAFGVALISAAFLIADVVLGVGSGVGFAVLIAGLEVVLQLALPMAKGSIRTSGASDLVLTPRRSSPVLLEHARDDRDDLARSVGSLVTRQVRPFGDDTVKIARLG